jgi:hypothetical protein
MKISHVAAAFFTTAILTGCAQPNVHAPNTFATLAPPSIKAPLYDPYSAYGSANATWRPPVVDRPGTIMRPTEPSTGALRPDYEHAPWATGALGGSAISPPGTF